MHGDSSEVREGERLDWPALATYLRWHVADAQIPGLRLDDDMQVSQFPGGHSNLTYLLRFGGAELVLRRPPLGPVAPRAHDMAREFRWLSTLHPVFPLAPRPYLLCEDLGVLGCVFYVMERRRGLVVRSREPMPLAHPERRRQLSEAMVDTLVDLHEVNITSGPVAELGKPIGFLDRQVRGWTERWERSRIEALPDLDAVAMWLAAHQPPDSLSPAVVHGDFKLDNVQLDPLAPSRVVAVLDWEMAALGDPLVDLGIMLAYWNPMDDAAGQPDALSTVTGLPGYLSRDELVARYAERSGRDLSDIRYYEVFAVFKIAVVIQQIYYRYRQGQTDDFRFATLGDKVQALATRARQLL